MAISTIMKRPPSRSSSSSSSPTTTRVNATSKIGIGSSKSSQLPTVQYSEILLEGLKGGINTFEAGHDGDEALAKAYALAIAELSSGSDVGGDEKVTLTSRFGYRGGSVDNSDVSFPRDVNLGEKDGAFHNMSREYVTYSLEQNPLVAMRKECFGAYDLIYMAHNPETQGGALPPGAGKDEIRGVIIERLKDAFLGLEEGCRDGTISSYGVCSNGLSLPKDHAMFLDWKDVIRAACEAAAQVHGNPIAPKLSTIQLPANLLETNGLSVAKDIKAHVTDNHSLPSSLSTYIYRPLTCYPDLGTTQSYPFKLTDYLIPLSLTAINNNTSSDPSITKSTHLIPNLPPFYQSTLNLALNHFDAHDIVLQSQSSSSPPLTTDQRETLEGCRLLQSMIHDLDAKLSEWRSVAAHQDEIMNRVIPLVAERFEGMDEESGAVLQGFFAAYGTAVKHAVAKNTRGVLRDGVDGGAVYDVSEDMTLQEFALGFLVGREEVDKVVLGCSHVTHVREAIGIVKKVL